MRTPPLLADFSHARPCKPFCENSLTLPFCPLLIRTLTGGLQTRKIKKVEGLCHLTESLSCSWSFFSRFPRKGDAMALSGIAAKSHPVIPPPWTRRRSSRSPPIVNPWPYRSSTRSRPWSPRPSTAFRRHSSWRFQSTVSSTGRLTHSEPDSTVSNALLLRCLWSCLSCACSRFRSCSRKSATSLGTDTCCHCRCSRQSRSFASFPLSTERRTPALPAQRQILKTFMEVPFVQGGCGALRGP